MTTIFAQATAKGKSGVAIIRISGDDALQVAEKLTKKRKFISHNLCLSNLYTPDSHIIDKAIIAYFQAPNSFTGEDIIEIHVHGSIAIMKLLSEVLLSYGICLAEPGEFTKRAFINGKMDLTSAEGLADLIEAETIMQHRQAIRHMSGEFEEMCNNWRSQLLKMQSLLEAYIDFPDEDIPDQVLAESQNLLENLKEIMSRKLDDKRSGERLRNGIVMAVLGEPNVGKSTMMNFLSCREVSIVSDIAGTTRDVIESHLDIGGYPIILADTAGLRTETDDEIEQEGIKRAMRAAENADIKLVMLDARKLEDISENILTMIDDNSIVIVNKTDLAEVTLNEIKSQKLIKVSLKKRQELDRILLAITEKAEKIAGIGDSPAITRERHRAQIMAALEALSQCDLKGDLVLAAEDIRIATRHLGILIGKIEVEEVLGEIFSNFCIGK